MHRLAVVGALLVAVASLPGAATGAGRYDLEVQLSGPQSFHALRRQLVPFTVRVVNNGPGRSPKNIGVAVSAAVPGAAIVYFAQDATGRCPASLGVVCELPALAPNQAVRFSLEAEWRAEDVRLYGRMRRYLEVSAMVNNLACGRDETNCNNNSTSIRVRLTR